ncbi:pilus assembly protein PilP [Pseudomonas sp. RW10S2]|uniref:pilus assembly protein PilP n=1 Tax=Pseudomonas sp. RW10S2 TaxID=459637 RepID=UPI00164805A0|nr:pilus assembly protein PilP [Pseudomonas sp. RW10S2]MBC3464953.1 pilus assembly protein PilP [Pseudomonas sp. RW10S2]
MRIAEVLGWHEMAGRSRMYRGAVVAAGVLLVLACGYQLRLQEVRAAYRQGVASEVEQRRLLQAREQQVLALDDAEAALDSEEKRLRDARWRLSGGESMSDLLDQLAVSGRTYGLVFERLDVEEGVEAQGYRQVPLQMQVSGRYAALRPWLGEWLGQLRLLQVTRLQLEPAADRPGLLQLQVSVQAFHAGETLPVPASLADEPAGPIGRAPELDPFAPWSSRRHAEGLAGVPLEQLEMVGSLSRAGQTQALVRWAGRVYRVAKGDRLGREEGEVIQVDQDQVEISERLFNGGKWQQHSSYLTLSRRTGARSEREETVDRHHGDAAGATGNGGAPLQR